MKVCFFVDNNNIENIDLSKPYIGNPGIGGTQFMILSVSYYIKKEYSNLEVFIAAPYVENLPDNIKIMRSDDAIDAAKLCKKNGIDIFVFQSRENEMLYKLIDKLELNSIAWAHNFPSLKELNQITESYYLKRYVCVSKEQYLLLQDHIIAKKATYIFNAIDTEIYKNYIKNVDIKNNIVCYLGSLIPEKGFHVLAKNWNTIKRHVPDAQLYVIGSGKLYDRNAKLGRFGIAEEKYENKFIKYLLKNENEIDENVHFYGVLGNREKLEVLSEAKVGVVNPTGRTETFCISAIEFECIGIPVVSIAKNALVDTIKNKKTGLISLSSNSIGKNVCKILKSKNYKDMSLNAIEYVENKFNINYIIHQWKDIFENIIDDKYEDDKDYICEKKLYNFKWIINTNKKLKKVKLFSKNPSIYEYGKYLKCLINKIM